MDITSLLVFINQHRALIGLFGFITYLCRTGSYFNNEGTDYVFELPEALALGFSDAYCVQGRVRDFTHEVSVYGIKQAEDVLLVSARRRKLALYTAIQLWGRPTRRGHHH